MLKNLASKLNKQVKKVNLKGTMQDKRVLYAVGLLSLLYVLFLANEKDFNSVFVFAIVGFLLSFFTKNMILILIVALLFTHFIKFTIHYKKEGMENKKKEGLKSKKEGMEDKEEEKEEDSKEEKEEEPKLDKVEVDEDLPENKDMSEEEKKTEKRRI
jgi:ABC-type transport system involved in cytochrome bd biosynthesis fused ATPase/permease subunit